MRKINRHFTVRFSPTEWDLFTAKLEEKQYSISQFFRMCVNQYLKPKKPQSPKKQIIKPFFDMLWDEILTDSQKRKIMLLPEFTAVKEIL